MTITTEVGGHLAAVTACLVEDAYRDWDRAAAETRRALEDWLTTPAGASPAVRAVYQAAVNREEQAAQHLERMLDMAERVLHIEQP